MDIENIISPLNVLIGGIVGIWLSNRLKKNTDIQTFRYTKPYELYVELCAIESNYDIYNMQNLFLQSQELHSKMKKIFDRASCLFDASPELLNAFKAVEDIQDEITSQAIDARKDVNATIPKETIMNYLHAITRAKEKLQKELPAVLKINLK